MTNEFEKLEKAMRADASMKSNASAKSKAINAAMEAFELEKIATTIQGTEDSKRLNQQGQRRSTLSKWRETMNRFNSKWAYTLAGGASVAVLAMVVAGRTSQVAALAGLAPMARDSGLRTGKRRIGGGRKSLRDVLYMAGLSAARTDPALRAFSERLRANGKAPKQAIIAVTRKLLTILNAMIRENRPYTQT